MSDTVDLHTYCDCDLQRDSSIFWGCGMLKTINDLLLIKYGEISSKQLFHDADVIGEPHIMATSTGYTFDVGYRML